MTSTIPLRSKTQGGTAFICAGQGDAVVLLHGVGLKLEAWSPQITALAQSHQVFALDMPGHGETTALDASARLPQFVAWLRQALDEMNLNAVNLVGHSMGALIALGLAIEQPVRVRRLALLNGVNCRPNAARNAVEVRAREIAEGKMDIDGPLSRWFEAKDEAERTLTRNLLSSVDQQGYATAYRAFAEGDDVYATRLGEITCPALFMTGDEDPNSTPAMSIKMAEATPRGHALILAGARHMMALTQPQEVNQALLSFLGEPVSQLKAPAQREALAS